MVNNVETALEQKYVSRFITNKGASPTSMPVSEVEAWLDASPSKRDNGKSYQIKTIPFNNLVANKQIKLARESKKATMRKLITQDVASKKARK